MVVITLARSVFVFLYHYSYRYDLQTICILTYFCCKIRKRNEEKKETLSSDLLETTCFVFHDRSDDAFGTISANPTHHHHHCSTEKPSARAPSSFISNVFLKIQKRNEKRNFELRRIQTFFVFHDRSDDAFGTISVQQSMGDFIIIIAPRRTARTFLFYISRIFVAIDTKTK